MTIRQALERSLFARGIFENEAAKLVAEWGAPPDPTDPNAEANPMAGRLDDLARDYPPQVLATCQVSLDDHVLRWIDREHPRHWARSMFAGTPKDPR